MEKERGSFHVGVNVLVIRDRKLLLGERKGDSWIQGGGWGLPGGHLEKGEHMKYAGLRELEEETGLHADDLEFAVLSNNNRDEAHYIQVGFLAKGVEDKEPELREPEKCYQWKWFSLDDLPPKIFIGHRGLLEAFVDKCKFIEGDSLFHNGNN